MWCPFYILFLLWKFSAFVSFQENLMALRWWRVVFLSICSNEGGALD
jgi:hypothetical protein